MLMKYSLLIPSTSFTVAHMSGRHQRSSRIPLHGLNDFTSNGHESFLQRSLDRFVGGNCDEVSLGACEKPASTAFW